MGLAQTGKSTIIKVVAEGYNPKLDTPLSPTLEYDRKSYSIFGKEVSMFDLGGQKSFLERFVGDLAEFIFSHVAVLVYVIDITQVSKLSRAKYYLELALKNIKTYSAEAKVCILLHKTDLIMPDKRSDYIKNFSAFITQDINKQLSIYETSIFNNSAISAFQQIVSNLEQKQISFQSISDNFSTRVKNYLEIIYLLDENGNDVLPKKKNHNSLKFNLTELFQSLKDHQQINEAIKYSINQFESKLVFNSIIINGYALIIIFSTNQLKETSDLYSGLIMQSIKLVEDLNNFIL